MEQSLSVHHLELMASCILHKMSFHLKEEYLWLWPHQYLAQYSSIHQYQRQCNHLGCKLEENIDKQMEPTLQHHQPDRKPIHE